MLEIDNLKLKFYFIQYNFRSCQIVQILFENAGGKENLKTVQKYLTLEKRMTVSAVRSIRWNKVPILICEIIIFHLSVDICELFFE